MVKNYKRINNARTLASLWDRVLKLDIIAQMKEGGPKELFYVIKDSKLLLSPNTWTFGLLTHHLLKQTVNKTESSIVCFL